MGKLAEIFHSSLTTELVHCQYGVSVRYSLYPPKDLYSIRVSVCVSDRIYSHGMQHILFTKHIVCVLPFLMDLPEILLEHSPIWLRIVVRRICRRWKDMGKIRDE